MRTLKTIASISSIVLLVAARSTATNQTQVPETPLGPPCALTFTLAQELPENAATADAVDEPPSPVPPFTISAHGHTPLLMSEIAADLYVVTGSGGNVAVRVTSEGVVLVDNKSAQNQGALLGCVARVTDRPVRYVIGTHHHDDHMGGNKPLADSARVRVLAHKNMRANMMAEKQPAPPAVVFTKKTSLFLGNATIEVHHFGNGHTNGDAVVLFPELDVLHAGDLFVDGLPFIDYANGGNSADWVDTLGGILSLDFETVIPGHGPLMTKRDVQAFRDRFVTLRTRMTQLIYRGVTKEQARAQLETTDLQWTLAPNSLFVRQSFADFYDELLGER